MLIISVVVVAILSAAYAFVPTFRAGVADVGQDVTQLLREGHSGGDETPMIRDTQ